MRMISINWTWFVLQEYIQGMIKRTDIPEELKNKEKIIFGNLNQLLTFHKNTLIKELEKCENAPEKLPGVFMKLVRCSSIVQRHTPNSALLLVEWC